MARTPVILFTDGQYFVRSLLEHYFARVLAAGEVRTTTARAGHELAPELREVDVLVARRVRVTREALTAAPRLRGIQSWGVGVELIDLPAATELGIPVANSPGNAIAVAEATFALLLAVTKRLLLWVTAARQGSAPDGSVRGTELAGKTLGIVGYGRIGRRVARIGRAFDMPVLAHDPFADSSGDDTRLVPLHDLLAQADIVSLHCTLTDETRHLIDARRLSLMRPTAILVNTARGQIVDEPALIAALQEGRLAGAGLDVFEREPPDPGNPLLHMPTVVATPHALPRTWESGERTAQMIEEGVLALLDGRLPEHTLNRGVGGPRRTPGA